MDGKLGWKDSMHGTIFVSASCCSGGCTRVSLFMLRAFSIPWRIIAFGYFRRRRFLYKLSQDFSNTSGSKHILLIRSACENGIDFYCVLGGSFYYVNTGTCQLTNIFSLPNAVDLMIIMNKIKSFTTLISYRSCNSFVL